MRDRRAAAFAALALLVGSAAGNDGPFAWRRAPNTAFASGESILYAIKYGPVTAGTATLEVVEETDVNGRAAYRVVSLARTNAAMDAVYKVRDRTESWIDRESLCSLRFHQNLREGFYKRRVETEYDHPAGRFLYRKWRKGRETEYDGPSVPFVQDVLSSLYYLRTLPLEVGASHVLPTNSGRGHGVLRVDVLARETVEVPFGRFVCFKVEPRVEGDGLFRASGKLEVWLTDDARRVPVLLRSRVAVGAFDAELTDYTPGGEEVPTQVGVTTVRTLRP